MFADNNKVICTMFTEQCFRSLHRKTKTNKNHSEILSTINQVRSCFVDKTPHFRLAFEIKKIYN